MLLSGADIEGVVVHAVPPEHPVAPVARPCMTHPREELAALAGAGVDGPDIPVWPAEHRAPGVWLAGLFDGDIPAVQQACVRHEVGAGHDHAVVVEVPDGQQGTVAVPALRGLLLGEETHVLRVPDLEGGEVGLFGGGGLVVRGGFVVGLAFAGRIRLVALFRLLGLAPDVLALLLFIFLNRPKPDRDHTAVVRPDRRPVPDDLERIGDAGSAPIQYRHLDAPVQAPPRQHVVRRPLVRGVASRAQDGQVGGVVTPPEAPIARARSVGGAERAGGCVVQLDPVAHIGAGGDGQRQ